jgi:hypothetical protein
MVNTDIFVRRDPEWPNLIDGTVFVTNVRHNGIYVTVRGNDEEQPIILAFDPDDIDGLREAIADFNEKNTIINGNQ